MSKHRSSLNATRAFDKRWAGGSPRDTREDWPGPKRIKGKRVRVMEPPYTPEGPSAANSQREAGDGK